MLKYGLFVVFLILVTIENGYSQKDVESRIVGGQNAHIGQFNYPVSLRIRKINQMFHICGGTLIAYDTVLTAAHCIYNDRKPSSYVVAVGILSLEESHPRNILEVTKIVIHEKYNPKTQINDIAVLKVRLPKGVGGTHAGIPIKMNNVTIPPKTNCTTVGWGATYTGGPASSTLKYVTVPVVPKTKCASIYGNIKITDGMMCAGVVGKDSCQGDSGGPLVCAGKLAGVVSFGIDCATVYPGVYTDVSRYQKWIKANSAEQHRIAALSFIFVIMAYFAN